MTIKIDIGASISSRVDASTEIERLFAGVLFPVKAHLVNHSSVRLVLPELKMLDVPALEHAEVYFSDIGLLKRAVSSLAQIARLRDMPLLASIELVSDDLEPEQVDEVSEIEPMIKPEQVHEAELEAKDESVKAVLVKELSAKQILVAVDGVEFEIKKNQLRDNGTLTAGGITAYRNALITE